MCVCVCVLMYVCMYVCNERSLMYVSLLESVTLSPAEQYGDG
jgi:hypothetical protein